MELPQEIRDYYEKGDEIGRLDKGLGQLELARIQELMERYLPPAPARIVDIGGGPGRHAAWLAAKGYEVHLVDPVPLHVQQATAVAAATPDTPIKSIQEGDARELPFDDNFAAVALCFGPLYHLIEREDRLRALREARRVLQPGGLLLAVVISRYSSTLVGFQRGWLEDAAYQGMIREEVKTGRHRNPGTLTGLFTTAYFHLPKELRMEIEEAGFAVEDLVAVQGPGWIVPDLEERLADAEQRATLLATIRLLERELDLMGISPHVMAVGRK